MVFQVGRFLSLGFGRNMFDGEGTLDKYLVVFFSYNKSAYQPNK
jgi:hypothetical protein